MAEVVAVKNGVQLPVLARVDTGKPQPEPSPVDRMSPACSVPGP